MDNKWTDEQSNAIELQGRHLLVAAAAGSGKTAVLVERIIRHITAAIDPIDVDRLLVATFTNAAAAEMRMRIRDAIEQAALHHPDSARLRKQLALLNRASITTLHSFCLDVIRRYYQLIPLDPGFRIANETEAQLLRQDLLTELLEEHYDKSGEDSDFWRLVDSFSGERSDDSLYRLIQRLYEFSQSHPWPEIWLHRMAESFTLESAVTVPMEATVEHIRTAGNDNAATDAAADGAADNKWFASLRKDVRLELQGIVGLLQQAVKLACAPGGPEPYLGNLQEDLHFVTELLCLTADQPWNRLYQTCQTSGFGKLKQCKGEEIDALLQEQVKQLRDMAKKRYSALREELFSRPAEQYCAELQISAPLMKILAELVIEFGNRYMQSKRSKGLVDFADLEHYCLHILRHPDSTPEQLIPSQAALEYQQQFAEVLLDEYQDTNLVQETIVALISRAYPGNRFMVGDVKQSIYGFRLAEPGLFIEKYKSFADMNTKQTAQTDVHSADISGTRINLVRNFRSRREIVDAVNFIFKQIMNEAAAEMDYDQQAELVCGTNYPPLTVPSPADLSVEVLLVDRNSGEGDQETISEDSAVRVGEEPTGDPTEAANEVATTMEADAAEWEAVQLESNLIAAAIKRLLGDETSQPFCIYDHKVQDKRPVVYRDIVILLRATQQWAPLMMEELRQAGIPVYAELASGYFQTTEIEVVMALLKVIDNPLQDIPLAAVLRSPMYSLTAEELALIRIGSKGTPFSEAVFEFDPFSEPSSAGLRDKLQLFHSQLQEWRQAARQGALADLLWRIYRETGYYDFVGGLPGGLQRQANLRALYDRCRQYEATSFRGLFRFLRFIERMRDSGADLGTARALGEQENVVRIMSIHKSKGLEFPVVFVAGLTKMFNQQDLANPFLLHKELGFGPKFVDTDLRVSFPTLPHLAIQRRMKYELLAEEMRVLYVALTRPKEKLFLVAAVKQLEQQIRTWAQTIDCATWNLPDYTLVKARSFMDWIGPALIRHPQATLLHSIAHVGRNQLPPHWMADEPSQWSISILNQQELINYAAAVMEHRDDANLLKVAQLEPVKHQGNSELLKQVSRRLDWKYPFHQATQYLSKTSVTEMKRLQFEAFAKMEDQSDPSLFLPGTVSHRNLARPTAFRRPRFAEHREPNAAEQGTIYHAVMQHVPLEGACTEDAVRETIFRMVERQILTSEQGLAVNAAEIAAFFASPLGTRMRAARKVKREVPFSYGLPAREVYPEATGPDANEMILIQGVIDCIFQEKDGLVLIDYKTDAIYNGTINQSIEKYRLQVDLYAKAIEHIWRIQVMHKYLYFFDGMRLVEM